MPHREKGNPKGDYNPGGDETAMRRRNVSDAVDSYNQKMVQCPHCGRKHSASNQGGASVGGGT